jgi:hypothetical protein
MGAAKRAFRPVCRRPLSLSDAATAVMTPTPLQSRHAILASAIVLTLLSGCGGGEPVPVVPTNEASSRSASGFAQTLERSPTAAGTVSALAAPRGAGLTAPGAASSAAPAAPATAGVLLEGAAGMKAIAALRDYTAPASSASTGLAKPRVEAILSPDALVGQVNSALTLVGARIVVMQSGNSRLMLELANAGASTTPEALSQRLAYSRAFEPYQPPPPQVEDHQPLPDEPQAP